MKNSIIPLFNIKKLKIQLSFLREQIVLKGDLKNIINISIMYTTKQELTLNSVVKH